MASRSKTRPSLAIAPSLSDLSSSDLSPCDLSPPDLSPCDLSPCDLMPSDLSPPDLSPCDLMSSDLSPCHLSPYDLSPSSPPNCHRSKKWLLSDFSVVFSPSLLSPAVLFSLLFSSSLLLSPASSIACYDGCRLAPGASPAEVRRDCVWKHDCGVCAVHADEVSQRLLVFYYVSG